ncbi:hypothetical protein TKK_0008637 [Trichogramma kaykai]|uniref:Fucosyltransferase N-terminal domain-containing protein n=1 Tax=Trichogramma kaykai TaxID=54128 RepID=A0ABD2X3N6_9HYME
MVFLEIKIFGWARASLRNIAQFIERQSVENHKKYNAVLFHGIDGQLNENDLPKKRSSQQKYIFMALESPANRWVSSNLNDYFNTTMTYIVSIATSSGLTLISLARFNE